MHRFSNLLKACLIASFCLVASAEFTSNSLTGLLSGTTLEHKVNLNDPDADGQDTITIRFTVPYTSWLAVGVNPTGAGMVGGEVIIGKPDENSVKKYKIAAKSATMINEQPDQTLINTSVQQSGGNTILTFTKILNEEGEFAIVPGETNTFIAAFGFSNSFSFHQGYGVQQLAVDAGSDATDGDGPTDDGTTAPDVTPPPTTAAPFTAPTNPPGSNALELSGELAGSTFSFQFNTIGDDSITITYTAPVAAWLSVGISQSGLMLGSEAVIGNPATGEVKKYNLNDKLLNGVVAMPDEKQTLVDASITQANGMTTLKYTKILVEDGEIPIQYDGENIFIAAQGFSNTLGAHVRKGSFSLTGKVIESRQKKLWKVHGVLAAVAWGVLCPMAILAGLFRKCIPGDGLWFNIHRSLQTLVVLLTIGAVVVAILALQKETPENLSVNHFSPDMVDGHRLIGLIVLILGIIQVAGGIARPHLPPKPESNPENHDEEDKNDQQGAEKSTVRKVWEFLHRLMGVVILGLAWYQIYLGIYWYNMIFNSGEKAPTETIYYAVVATFGVLILLGVAFKVVKG